MAASHSRAVLSSEAVTTRCPSGLNAADKTALVMAAQDGEAPAGGGIPQPRGLVV